MRRSSPRSASAARPATGRARPMSPGPRAATRAEDGPGLTVDLGASAEAEVEQCATCHARREAFGDGNPLPGTPFHDAFNLALLRAGAVPRRTARSSTRTTSTARSCSRGCTRTACAAPTATSRTRRAAGRGQRRLHPVPLAGRQPRVSDAAAAPRRPGAPFPRARQPGRAMPRLPHDRADLHGHRRAGATTASGCRGRTSPRPGRRTPAPTATPTGAPPGRRRRSPGGFPTSATAGRTSPPPSRAARWVPEEQAAGAAGARRGRAGRDRAGDGARAAAAGRRGRGAERVGGAGRRSPTRWCAPRPPGRCGGLPPPERLARLAPALGDPLRAVRVAAARALLDATPPAAPPAAARRWRRRWREWQAALAARADFPETHLQIGGAGLTLRDWRLAEQAFTEAAALDPQLVDAWAMVVRIRAATGDAAGARAALDAALALNPGNAGAARARGRDRRPRPLSRRRGRSVRRGWRPW